jgi:hypothetical protein
MKISLLLRQTCSQQILKANFWSENLLKLHYLQVIFLNRREIFKTWHWKRKTWWNFTDGVFSILGCIDGLGVLLQTVVRSSVDIHCVIYLQARIYRAYFFISGLSTADWAASSFAVQH